MTIIIGIESTAHTFGVAVIDPDGNILSNVRDMYTTKEGGMIPMVVRSHHKDVALKLFEEALMVAGISERNLEAIAFSNSPGLAPCLLEGMEFVKKLSKRLDIPMVKVNHCVAHLEIGASVGATDPVMLYASGANTQIIAYESGKYRVFGETLDLGVGNFIDTFARHAKLGFPGGPKIQKLAEEYIAENGSENIVELPYSIKGMDVSFSGIQTQLKNRFDKGEDLGLLSHSMQETVFAMLVEAAERALAHTGKTELPLGGGVACNSRLQEMCKIMCEERGVKYFCPPRPLLVDNAGMIGYLGLKMYKSGIKEMNPENVDISPRQRTDEVYVTWK